MHPQALRQLPGSAVPLLNSPSQESMRMVHADVMCDGCGMSPIRGPRYQDSAYLDFDLCHSCYTNNIGGT